MRATDTGPITPPIEKLSQPLHRPPAGLVAAKLIDAVQASDRSLVYIALGEGAASKIVEAIRCWDPAVELVVFPPWDCLPFDRVPPSRHSMGRRMDALRVWLQPSLKARLLITSLDAVLQRVAPLQIIESSWYELGVGERFDRPAFESFARRTGYVEDGLVDEPGELAFRDDVIDIFPAGASVPMRIAVSKEGTVSELRSYDPSSQRTTSTVQKMVFGPASEAILADGDQSDGIFQSDISECRLFQLYGSMQTVFDVLGRTDIAFADGADEKLNGYFELIADARQARRRTGSQDADERSSLYLGPAAWSRIIGAIPSFVLDLGHAAPLPRFADRANARRSVVDFATAQMQSGQTVVLAGTGREFDGLCRRLERETGKKLVTINGWVDARAAKPGSLLKIACALDQGFVAGGVALITANDILGELTGVADVTTRLLEPELRLGDVVVHEDHGIGVLKDLESVDVDGLARDTARLCYRDGASVLVPMDEFGKLWRYGSEPDAVTLDRLHTEAWSKRQVDIGKDIRVAARQMLRLARERREAEAVTFVPAREVYAMFARRFPYSETRHQTAAIDAVLQDLGSGTAMNRLICGDVGFGKTEVALRAAAAVALSGGQVVVIAPTTVLVRQHFTTFEQRFAGTGVQVAMLSRVIAPDEAKQVKRRLAKGEVGIVVATQAILAKDVSFSRLGLLIVDEEHRFGSREKHAMRKMAPLLHTLVMSATPIPRTLQAALIGVQDVSLLATAPSKRRPVRTFLTPVDRASMRTALLREHRRGGQSFVVVPQIEDIDRVKDMLEEIAPELSTCVAHGKMKAAMMDDIMVRFADGDGDILLSTNIIESGLDVPRANTIFVWRADRFGVAQLHQLRGRVGRGKAQGIAFLIMEDEISKETHLRLSTVIENDRLGAGLAISMQDLDLRGAGDLLGQDQAGHVKLIGISLYQKMLERAVASLRKEKTVHEQTTVLNLGVVGAIPVDYVPDGTVRLNLYARLLKAVTQAEIDGFAEEFEDRFGELPGEVVMLFRLAKLRIVATQFGVNKLDAGPRAMAVSFASKPTRTIVKSLCLHQKPIERDGRLVFERASENSADRLEFFEILFGIT